jgi:GntR family transcriptional regulator, transcriptional repressor for pyruvate dehydrogenase complex
LIIISKQWYNHYQSKNFLSIKVWQVFQLLYGQKKIMAKFKPIKQSRVSKEVCDQLKQSILVGHFQPGDKLPSERELVEEFQVSRVAIREALRTLENSGFITTRQGVNGGTYVTELTFGYIYNAFLDLFLADKISIPELYRVRLLIEPEIARLAALAGRGTCRSHQENSLIRERSGRGKGYSYNN